MLLKIYFFGGIVSPLSSSQKIDCNLFSILIHIYFFGGFGADLIFGGIVTPFCCLLISFAIIIDI